ncbi:hypothetical protein LXT21_06330 [Myxococcus sp. K38C18041901]|uniref:DUF6624 domain-containing protein n=1 Tax=Myxococcus guangdongensis TaxID=2906760 RepID=UPI0020A8021B|nr:DUF6624 domain-containing protein [Myxococcus guangdongensis]MCP3058380.1 hypothetical protein [Myxococcus guangdongensis]
MRRLVILLAALNLAACAHSAGGAATPAESQAAAAPRPVPTPEARKAAMEATGLAAAGNNEAALPLYRAAWEGGVRSNNTAYNAACAASLLNQGEEALMWLGRAADEGFDDVAHMKKDTDLDNVRGLPGFAAVEKRVADEAAKQLAAADPALRDELLARMEVDQQVRMTLMRSNFQDEAAKKKLEEVDASNTAWLKDVIAKKGWPGQALVGKKASFAAWLLVQHADKDVAFQEQVLPMLEQAVARGEGSKQNLAYLTDRVLVNTGKPQRYGTQMEEVNGQMEPRNLEDPANVDARRAAVGLGTMAEYKASFEAMRKQAAEQKP